MYKILTQIAKINFIQNVMKYRLSAFTSDVILDYENHAIIVLKDIPGILIFNIEETKNKLTHYEVYFRSRGEISFIGVFPFDIAFPTKQKEPDLRLIE